MVEKLNALRSKGSFIIDKDIETQLSKDKKCLGLVVGKNEINNNSTVTLTSWDCSSKRQQVCLLDSSKYSTPQRPVKFPCISQSNRPKTKRDTTEQDSDLTPNYGESKPIIKCFTRQINKKINVTENEFYSIHIYARFYFHSIEKAPHSAKNTKSQDNKGHLNLQRLDTALDPAKEEERKIAKEEAFSSYNERFGKLDLQKSYMPLFELLWYSQLPCSDTRGITSVIKDELSFVKKCYWK